MSSVIRIESFRFSLAIAPAVPTADCCSPARSGALNVLESTAYENLFVLCICMYQSKLFVWFTRAIGIILTGRKDRN